MYRTLISKASALIAVAMIASVFSAAPALGQSTITINNSSCTGYTATGPATALVITCNGTTGNSACTIASSAGNPISPLGTPTILTATCAGATAVTWTSGGSNAGACPAAVNSGGLQMALKHKSCQKFSRPA